MPSNVANTMMIRLLIGAGVLLIAIRSTAHSEEGPSRRGNKHYFNSYLGEKPRELKTEAMDWVNGRERLTLEKLHGKVVWLEFNF